MLPWFDANCMIGRRGIPAPDAPVTAQDLLREMDRLGIAQSLVCHAQSQEAHPADGNTQILRDLREADPRGERLFPCWAVLPPDLGEMPEPRRLVAEMRAEGVRAARVFPRTQLFPFTLWTMGPLLAELETAGIPLILDMEPTHWSNDEIDWRELLEIGAQFPRLAILITHASIGMLRHVLPALQRMPRLFLETSYFQPHNGLAQIARRVGAERLVFGTGMPVWSPCPPMQMLEVAELPAEERARIAGNTLRELLGLEAASPRPARGPSADHPTRGAFDAHGHLGDWFRTAMFDAHAEGLVGTLDRLEMSGLVVSHMLAIGPDFRKGNALVAEATARHPGRLFGYATVNPHYIEESRAELEQCFRHPGFIGLKFHCGLHNCPVEAPGYRPAIEFANEHGLTILIHHAGPVERMAPLAEQFPAANFLSAHVGGWNGRVPDVAMQLAKQYANVYLDLAASTVYNRALERMVREVGAHKIVHGSDMPLMDPAYQIGRVTKAEITDQEKETILVGNARRLYFGGQPIGAR
jgi:predicted TIM-barrel fold metal-dependent hydrolase